MASGARPGYGSPPQASRPADRHFDPPLASLRLLVDQHFGIGSEADENRLAFSGLLRL